MNGRGCSAKGYGLAGCRERCSLPPYDHGSRGEFWWGGVAGTQWWISPKTGVAGLLMTQRQMAFFHPFAIEFKRLAYEAVRRRA